MHLLFGQIKTEQNITRLKLPKCYQTNIKRKVVWFTSIQSVIFYIVNIG